MKSILHIINSHVPSYLQKTFHDSFYGKAEIRFIIF